MKTMAQCLAVILGSMLCASFAIAQPFPAKPVKIIIGFPAGTLPDVVARSIGQKFQARFGQPFVIESRPGASSTIAAKAVVAAPPDGYTLLMGSADIFSPLMTAANSVDALKELAPVADVLYTPLVLFSSAKLPVTSLSELVAYSKAHPGKLNYAAQVPQYALVMQALKDRTGIDYTLISGYKSGAAAMLALVSGEADVAIGVIGTYPAQVQAGTVRGLMVASARRASQLPNVPTAAELGLENFEFRTGIALWAPLNTPKDIVRLLSTEVSAALRDPDIAEQIRRVGAEPTGSTPEELAQSTEKVMRFWAEAIRAAGFKPQ